MSQTKQTNAIENNFKTNAAMSTTSPPDSPYQYMKYSVHLYDKKYYVL